MSQDNENFLQDHQAAYEEYEAKREADPDYEFSGELAEFQKQWEERRKKQEESDRAAIDLDKEIGHLRATYLKSIPILYMLCLLFLWA